MNCNFLYLLHYNFGGQWVYMNLNENVLKSLEIILLEFFEGTNWIL